MADIIKPSQGFSAGNLSTPASANVKYQAMDDGSHAEVVSSIDGGVVASDGNILSIDSMAQTLNYNTDGTLNYVEVVDNGDTYRQTLTYTNGVLTGIGRWVKQ